MNLQQTIRRILREEIDENRKERIFKKVVNVLTTSIYPREKGNKIIFWFISDQLNEPVFEYSKPKKTLKVLKGRVKNYLDTFIPESLGDEFRTNVLKNVFNNLTSNSLILNKIIVENRLLKEDLNSIPSNVRRRINLGDEYIKDTLKSFIFREYDKNKDFDSILNKTITRCVNKILFELPDEFESYTDKLSKIIYDYIKENYKEFILDTIEEIYGNPDDESVYCIIKHSERYGGRGFTDCFKSWYSLLQKYGWWFTELDWNQIKQNLETEKRVLIKSPSNINSSGYYFSISKI
jgi:hypothetical protein